MRAILVWIIVLAAGVGALNAFAGSSGTSQAVQVINERSTPGAAVAPDLKAKQAIVAKAIAADFKSRVDYASAAEVRYLQNDMDVTVKASGPLKTILTISYVLMGRVMVFKTINDPDFLSIARGLGFKTVVLTDGYRDTWKYSLTEDRFIPQ